jgi:hypothetical protein
MLKSQLYDFCARKYHFIRDSYYILRYRNNMERVQKVISKKEVVNIVFLAMNVSMWKYDKLYELLKSDKCFNPIIVLAPRIVDATEVIRQHDIDSMKAYFDKRGYFYIDGYDVINNHGINLIDLNPDLIFYTQPYENAICKQYDFLRFRKSLFCHIPYAFIIVKYNWNYNLLFFNICWKLFYPNKLYVDYFKSYSRYGWKNLAVTGYPIADLFLDSSREIFFPWKLKNDKLKRIIWAPHHSFARKKEKFQIANFLEIYDSMYYLAKELAGKIQMAFKPHPHLKGVLYKHPDWGQKKTDDYYKKWEDLDNTLLHEGDYVDLFKTSDALIHDSGSFTVEYLYVNKPVLHIDVANVTEHFNSMGLLAYNAHYKAKSMADIKQFLFEVVIAENDPKRMEREQLLKTYLLPPNGKTASENIYNEIKQALHK